MFKRNIGFALIVLLISCTGNDQPENYTVEIIDGVRTVQNLYPLEETNLSIQLELTRKIGGLDAADENLNFYNPVDITSDPSGNLFILDKGNFRAVKITTENNVTVFGTQGVAPGEFLTPWTINLDKNGNLIISDNNKYHVFSTDGKLIRTRSLPESLFDMTTLESGNFLSRNLGDSTLLKISDKEGTVLSLFGIPNNYDTYNMTTLSNRIYCTSNKNNIFVSFQHANLIQKYTLQGELELNITRYLNYEITYEKKKASINKEGELVMTGRGWSHVSNGIAVDTQGLIWIATAGRQETDEEILTPVYSDRGDLIKSTGNSLIETDMYKLEV
ncbi:6-bladed beta-propeller, partial [candidate division KSB1 bacterium]